MLLLKSFYFGRRTFHIMQKKLSGLESDQTVKQRVGEMPEKVLRYDCASKNGRFGIRDFK